jgi:hypothetical protein
VATSIYHAQHSIKRFGGCNEDYIAIHEFIDRSKMCHGDIRHRAILHNTFGVWLVQEVFGRTITIHKNGKPVIVAVREIAEQHILDDLGFIPSVGDWLKHMEIQPWMSGAVKRVVNREDILSEIRK